MKKTNIIVEPSRNTHTLEAQKIELQDLENGILKLTITGEGIITHGEHGTLRTEATHVIKYVQQELNPVTETFQNAFD
jgi:hypothetical protein